jgi:hypothetical protein
MRWITFSPADQRGTSIVPEPPAAGPSDERRTIVDGDGNRLVPVDIEILHEAGPPCTLSLPVRAG